MPSRASPFSRVGAGAACKMLCQSCDSNAELFVSFEPYLVAAVDRGVLSDAVNLAAGAVVDNVVR